MNMEHTAQSSSPNWWFQATYKEALCANQSKSSMHWMRLNFPGFHFASTGSPWSIAWILISRRTEIPMFQLIILTKSLRPGSRTYGMYISIRWWRRSAVSIWAERPGRSCRKSDWMRWRNEFQLESRTQNRNWKDGGSTVIVLQGKGPCERCKRRRQRIVSVDEENEIKLPSPSRW